MRGNRLGAFADDEDTRERTRPAGFAAEELTAVREQYETRLAEAEERNEEMEWRLRMALARTRDAEAEARRAADDLRRVHESLAEILEGGSPVEKTQVRKAPDPTPTKSLGQPRRSAPPPVPALPKRVA
jgi:hypothetical protein